MLKIRLQRIGKRGQAYFRVVVLEHTTRPKGKYLELLGSYDPHKNEITVDAEKIKYWMSQGAHLSDTVNNLLVGKGVIEGEKVKVWKPKKKKPSSRAQAEGKEATPKAAPATPAEEQKAQEAPAPEEAPPAPIPETPKEAAPEEVKTEEVAQAATQ